VSYAHFASAPSNDHVACRVAVAVSPSSRTSSTVYVPELPPRPAVILFHWRCGSPSPAKSTEPISPWLNAVASASADSSGGVSDESSLHAVSAAAASRHDERVSQPRPGGRMRTTGSFGSDGLLRVNQVPPTVPN